MVDSLAKLASYTSKALPGMGLVLMVVAFLVGVGTGNWSLNGWYLLIVVACCVLADRIGSYYYKPWYDKRYGPNAPERPPRWKPWWEPLNEARAGFVDAIFAAVKPP